MQTNAENKQNSERNSEGFESSQLIKWIKTIKWMLFFACLVFIGIIVWYWFILSKGNGFSTNSQDWGTFGDYVGGVLNPFFSFLALIALLLTINIQTIQLKRSEEDTIKQTEHHEREFKRYDYHRLIEKLAERINKNYKEKKIELNNGSGLDQISLFTILVSENNKRQNFERISEAYEDRSSSTFNTIWMIENDLNSLCFYIKEYELVSQYKGSPIHYFYKREFEDLITALIFHEWISDSDNNGLFTNFVFV